jgi:hypothetical protein
VRGVRAGHLRGADAHGNHETVRVVVGMVEFKLHKDSIAQLMKDGEVTFDEWTDSIGLKGNQKGALVVRQLREALINDEISTNATAREAQLEIERQIVKASEKLESIDSRYKRVEDLLAQTEISARSTAITDQAIINSVNAFDRILEIVIDRFGEQNMSDAVMCKAIEAGSYCAWRSIMGPKTEGEAKRRSERTVW